MHKAGRFELVNLAGGFPAKRTLLATAISRCQETSHPKKPSIKLPTMELRRALQSFNESDVHLLCSIFYAIIFVSPRSRKPRCSTTRLRRFEKYEPHLLGRSEASGVFRIVVDINISSERPTT
jgi:hypothetical protein